MGKFTKEALDNFKEKVEQFKKGGSLKKDKMKEDPETSGTILKYEQGGSGIHIKKANRGKFTAKAKAAGMGVQEYASHVLANKEKHSPETVKQANFARNATKFNH